MKALATVFVLAAAALTLTACGSGGGTTTTSTSTSGPGSGAASGSAGGPVVSAKSVSGLGTVLVDSGGKTLYVFAPDKKSKVTCTGSCAAVWPPLKVEAGEEAEASGGVRAGLLGTDPDPEGGEVVTYAGWPLYAYVADTGPGSASGQAVNLNGGYWYVITPAGKIVK
jgi:predicted lipoprotein with Yx(FWY)xxD motif